MRTSGKRYGVMHVARHKEKFSSRLAGEERSGCGLTYSARSLKWALLAKALKRVWKGEEGGDKLD